MLLGVVFNGAGSVEPMAVNVAGGVLLGLLLRMQLSSNPNLGDNAAHNVWGACSLAVGAIAAVWGAVAVVLNSGYGATDPRRVAWPVLGLVASTLPIIVVVGWQSYRKAGAPPPPFHPLSPPFTSTSPPPHPPRWYHIN